MSAQEMNNECERYLEKLKITPERRLQIAKLTVRQLENVVYRTERAEKLTASNFGAAIKRREYTSCHSLVKAIPSQQYFTSEAVEYGKVNEAVALSLLEETLNLKLALSGLFIDVIYPFLGASPDGLIGQHEIVEVKCLLKVSKLGITLEEAAKTIPSLCIQNNNGALSLKRNHNYYYQVQGQLHITQREVCTFVVFVNDKSPLYIERIRRDDLFWETNMKEKLITFYKCCILPEIIRGNLKRGLRCVDPPYIIEAQSKRQTRDNESKKETSTCSVTLQ